VHDSMDIVIKRFVFPLPIEMGLSGIAAFLVVLALLWPMPRDNALGADPVEKLTKEVATTFLGEPPPVEKKIEKKSEISDEPPLPGMERLDIKPVPSESAPPEEDADATPEIIKAVKAEDSARVETLLKEGADVNATDSEGNTPLHWAMRRENFALMRQLLNHPGINVNQANNDLVSPYTYAFGLENDEMLTLLKAHGAEP
jgi:hypothetical protein